MATKPWDARLAHALVRPLAGTRVTPNHVTTLGLLVGLTAAALYAHGGAAASVGGALYCLFALIDHADGELARMTNRCSARGQLYDRTVDLIVKIAVFSGMGTGLRHGPLGWWGPALGLVAGVAFVSIFMLRSATVRRIGPPGLEQLTAGPFEIEDILYVIAPATWLGWLQPFLLATAVGASLFACYCAARLARVGGLLPRYASSKPR
jgi:archaetidylinositol phosphate synthase